MEIKNFKILFKRLKKEGFYYLFVLWRFFIDYIASYIGEKSFDFNNIKYEYFYHKYNHTWSNERSIEIPIIMREINSNPSKEILEIGNVLSHYFSFKHDIIDKYEKSENVINEDASIFKFKKKYDLIISISTLEHVGWDEYPKEKDKILKTISNLKKHLNKNGEILITVPINYNRWLDEIIKKGKFFNEIYFMKRKLFNRWVQTNWEQVKNCGFCEGARGIAIIAIKK